MRRTRIHSSHPRSSQGRHPILVRKPRRGACPITAELGAAGMGTPAVQLRGAEAGSHPQDPGNQVARAQRPSRQAYPFLRSHASCLRVPSPRPNPPRTPGEGPPSRLLLTGRGQLSQSPPLPQPWRYGCQCDGRPQKTESLRQQGHLANCNVSPVSGG